MKALRVLVIGHDALIAMLFSEFLTGMGTRSAGPRTATPSCNGRQMPQAGSVDHGRGLGSNRSICP